MRRGRAGLVAVVVVLGLVLVGGPTTGIFRQFDSSPCDDDLAVEAPQMAVGMEYNRTAGTVTIRHEGGDALTFDRCWDTDALWISFELDGVYRSVTWAAHNRSGVAQPPIDRSDSITIRDNESTAAADATVNETFELGTTVRLMWTGYNGSSVALGKEVLRTDDG